MGSSTTMKLLVLSALVAAVSAGILEYGSYGKGPVAVNEAPPPPTTTPAAGCSEGKILHVDGTCVEPIVTKKVFVYDVPKQEPSGPPPTVPPPRVEENILFVHL